MPQRGAYDAIVVGSGPNGLAAAITLARTGLSVLVYEAKETIGGGARSAELTLPGFVHDVCSAIHPLGVASPFFRMLPLAEHGLEWIYPPASLAHPFDDGTAVLLERSVAETAQALGPDAAAYRQLMAPLVAAWGKLADALLGPLRPPRHPPDIPAGAVCDSGSRALYLLIINTTRWGRAWHVRLLRRTRGFACHLKGGPSSSVAMTHRKRTVVIRAVGYGPSPRRATRAGA